MSQNVLELKRNEPGSLLFQKVRDQKILFIFSSISLKRSEQVRNRGIILDSDLSFDNHNIKVTRIAFCHFKNTSKVRIFTSQTNTEKMYRAFI